MAVIQGVLIDSETMKPIPYAAVTLVKGGLVVDKTHTEADGSFRFDNVPIGEFVIIGRSPVHNPVTHPLIVEDPNKIYNVELRTVKITLSEIYAGNYTASEG